MAEKCNACGQEVRPSVSVLEVPYRPCTIHGGYDPSLKQCPGCLDAKLVDAPRPSEASLYICPTCRLRVPENAPCPHCTAQARVDELLSKQRPKEATVAQDWIDDPSGIPAPIACPRGPYGTCAWARRSECATHRTNEPVRPDQTKYVITCDGEPRTDSALTVLDRLLQCFTEADDGLQTDNLEKVASAIVWGQEIVRKAQRTEPPVALSPTKTSSEAYRKQHAEMCRRALEYLNSEDRKDEVGADAIAAVARMLEVAWDNGFETALAAHQGPETPVVQEDDFWRRQCDAREQIGYLRGRQEATSELANEALSARTDARVKR